VKVIICPDKFAGTLSALAAAQAIAEGWRAAAPGDDLLIRPVADGGPGFLEVLHASVGGDLVEVPTTDPLGRSVTGHILKTAEGTAYVESAAACGLAHLVPNERNPRLTTSFGLGSLVRAAGAGRVVIGLGGSGTNDAGAGWFEAMGITPVDADGRPLTRGGAALLECAGLRIAADFEGELIGASDVDNPLTGPHGASAVFGPQKGATPDDVELLEAALTHWAAILVRYLPGCPPDLARRPGGGAAGGLGAAILALGGRIISGIDLVLDQTGLGRAIEGADLVITGEGSFDQQSLHGKVISGVAQAAADHGIPCVVLAGRVSTGRREQGAAGITEAHSLVDHYGSVEQALAEPAQGLRDLASKLARQYSPAGR
jgi:glycerate 2-kinase